MGKIIPKNNLEIKVKEEGVYVYLKEEAEKLHTGKWNSKVTNRLSEDDNLVGLMYWRVFETAAPVIYADSIEVRPEYENTNVAFIILNIFRQNIIKPLVEKYGKGVVQLSVGFANQKLWDLVNRKIDNLGLIYKNESAIERDNTGIPILRKYLLEREVNVLGGVVVKNFSLKEYEKLYINAFNTTTFFYSYVYASISDEGDIIYSPNDYDDVGPEQIPVRLDISSIEIDTDISIFTEYYKLYPNVVYNIISTIGENGDVYIYNAEPIKANKLKEELDNLVSKGA